MLIGPVIEIAFEIVTFEFVVDDDLPITRPPKLAILFIVRALIEPVPAKLVVPEPLQVKALETLEPSVKELP